MIHATTRPIRARLTLTLAGFGLVALVTCLVAPLVGSSHISLARVFDRSIPFNDNVDAQIFFVARMPRVFAGALTGASLAAAASFSRALLRNAWPRLSRWACAGASLGAMLAIVLARSSRVGPFSAVPLASLRPAQPLPRGSSTGWHEQDPCDVDEAS